LDVEARIAWEGGQPYVTLDEKQVMGKEAEVLSGP